MKLWPHQERAIAEILQAVDSGYRNILVTSPTGGGKSRIILEQIKLAGYGVSLYTDRRMLLRQLSADLDREGIDYGIRAAGHESALLRPIQLSMMQTEGSRSLDGNREVHPSGLVIVDEAHKMAGSTMMALDEEHLRLKPKRVKIGTTATPLGIGHFYDKLIVAGTNTELRQCGALVPAKHYGPDEPDTKWIGTVAVDGGECGIVNAKRTAFAHRVFGRVLEHIPIYNPELKAMLLFAPGVEQSKWFAQELTKHGIPSAHIDGSEIWVDGEVLDPTDENRKMIADRSKDGDIKCVCNRFVMREGINWPWLYHGIFATVFGSLTSYLQAGGRLLRNDPSLPGHVVISDHGGNWHRHGSLNADREWELEYDDRIVQGIRKERIQNKEEPEPIVCPKCHACRLSGATCRECGYRHVGRVRSVLQKDGSLKEMRGDIYREPRRIAKSDRVKEDWINRVRGIRHSKKETVVGMTFAQAEVSFARDHNWQYPPRGLPEMPLNPADWFRPIQSVPKERLSR
jgi:superfamily II DNA or RNA helicase